VSCRSLVWLNDRVQDAAMRQNGGHAVVLAHAMAREIGMCCFGRRIIAGAG
jgi:hypothetical protein